MVAGFGCGGIVRNVVSTVSPDGSVVSTAFVGAPLPVDIAVSDDQMWLAVAHAGAADFSAPRPFLAFPGDRLRPIRGRRNRLWARGTSLSIMALSDISQSPAGSCTFPDSSQGDIPVTAVAFTSDGRLLAQTREPAQLLVLRDLPFGTMAIGSSAGRVTRRHRS